MFRTLLVMPRSRWARSLVAAAATVVCTTTASAQTPVGMAGDRDTWRLRDLDGATIDFAQFRGRPVVVNVWATWCPPCIAELASFDALRDSLARHDAGRSVAFVFVAPEPARRVAAFARKRALSLPFYVELDPIPASFEVRTLPTTLVLDGAGRVVLHHRGAADWNTPRMRAFLLALARGATVVQ